MNLFLDLLKTPEKYQKHAYTKIVLSMGHFKKRQQTQVLVMHVTLLFSPIVLFKQNRSTAQRPRYHPAWTISAYTCRAMPEPITKMFARINKKYQPKNQLYFSQQVWFKKTNYLGGLYDLSFQLLIRLGQVTNWVLAVEACRWLRVCSWVQQSQGGLKRQRVQ